MANEPKTYVPKCSAKSVADGRILKLSFKAKELVEFAHQHVNERGYLNLCVSERRELGQFGDTHTVWLDTWKPGQNQTQRTAAKPTTQEPPENHGYSDVPF